MVPSLKILTADNRSRMGIRILLLFAGDSKVLYGPFEKNFSVHFDRTFFSWFAVLDRLQTETLCGSHYLCCATLCEGDGQKI